ncbi:MAG: hypothetical protein CSA66_03915 [Proteobacteria bacterium]|nr:MAG: hypothetical protein CSA66_03915 [Pseudomonadota bacterium]
MILEAKRLAVCANNTANLSTEGFMASQVAATELASGGVAGDIVPTKAPAPLTMRDGQVVAMSNTDLVRETVNRTLALRTYQANAAVAGAASDLDREILDLTA